MAIDYRNTENLIVMVVSLGEDEFEVLLNYYQHLLCIYHDSALVWRGPVYELSGNSIVEFIRLKVSIIK